MFFLKNISTIVLSIITTVLIYLLGFMVINLYKIGSIFEVILLVIIPVVNILKIRENDLSIKGGEKMKIVQKTLTILFTMASVCFLYLLGFVVVNLYGNGNFFSVILFLVIPTVIILGRKNNKL